VKTTGTDLYAVQRREMAVSVDIGNDLNTPIVCGGAQLGERTEEEDLPPGEGKRSKTRKRKKKSKEAQVAEDGGEAGTPKKRRKRQPKPEPEYIIPDVECKETTFKGRLGALRNTYSNVYDLTFTRICLSEYSTSQQEARQ
jgi:UV DNA damage endonuclease